MRPAERHISQKRNQHHEDGVANVVAHIVAGIKAAVALQATAGLDGGEVEAGHGADTCEQCIVEGAGAPQVQPAVAGVSGPAGRACCVNSQLVIVGVITATCN